MGPLPILIAAIVAGGTSVPAPLARGQGQPPSAAAHGAGRIAGRVVDPATGTGIGAVELHLVERDARTLTDDSGRFAFEAVPPGRYHVRAALEGFQAGGPWEVRVTGAGDPDVKLTFRLAVAIETSVVEHIALLPEVRPAAVTTLESREILSAAGALEDVNRLLQMKPGVAASQDNRDDLLVRGGGAIENHTRVDGFDIPNASHFGAHGGTGGGLAIVAPWLIERAAIEVGALSVAFGERASSSVDITIRDGRRGRAGGAVAAGVGGVMAALDGPLAGGSGSWLVAARRSFLSLVFNQGEDRAVPSYGDLVAKSEWRSPGGRRVEVLAIAGHDDVDVASDRDPTERLTDEQTVTLAGLRVDAPIGSRAHAVLVASVGTNHLDARYVDQGRLEFGDRSREAEVRLRGEVRHDLWSSSQLMAGIAVKHASLSFDLREDPYWNEFGILVAGVQSEHRFSEVDVGLYAEASGPVVGGVRATAGVRLDRSAGNGSWYLSPRARFERPVGSRMRLVGSLGAYRQSIPYIWKGSHPDNRLLAPVFSAQATGGLEWAGPLGFRVLLEGFLKRYRGYPVDPAVPARVLVSALADFESPFVGRLDPVGRVRAWGLDSGATRRLGRRLDLALGYSYWRVSQRAIDGVWRPADHDVRHQGRIELQLSRTRGWAGSLAWRYAHGRPYTPFDVRASIAARGPRYDRARINAGKYPPYHRLDLRADRYFSLGRTTLVFFAELENAYNRDNVYLYDWSGSARAARPVYQWGRTPVGGVRLEF